MSPLTLSTKAKKALAPVVANFDASDGVDLVTNVRVSINLEQMPVPWLANLALTEIIGCTDLGRADKTLWRLPFRYKGVEALLSAEKFGVRLYIGSSEPPMPDSKAFGEEIIGKLGNVIAILERDILKHIATERFDEARVVVQNQSGQLRRAYEFFREKAETELVRPDAQDTREIGAPNGDDGPITRMFAGVARHFEHQRDGSLYAIAAINAYFSWLEHVLVLMLAFTTVDPTAGLLKTHIGDTWGDKFRRVFVAGDGEAGRVSSRLHEVAETYRNTYGHGGFDKAGAAIGIQLDDVGAVPASLSDVRRSPPFEIYPLASGSFADVLAVFAETDAFLRDGPRRLAMLFIGAALPVAFDRESRDGYQTAMASDNKFKAFVERLSEQFENYVNMEF